MGEGLSGSGDGGYLFEWTDWNIRALGQKEVAIAGDCVLISFFFFQ